MPALATTALTLADLATRMVEGSLDRDIVELLSVQNPILEDMLWVEGNTTTGNRTTVRTGLPEGTWRTLYGGVQPTKSTTTQITDTCGMLEAYSEVDKALVDMSNDANAFRLDEDSAHMQGLAKQMADAVFYSTVTSNPEQIHGLAPRFNTLVEATAASAGNVLDSGGVGSDNTSIWCVPWDSKIAAGLYPKGTKAGLTMRNLGEHTADAADGGKFQVMRTHFKWNAGFMVRDWRYIARIANIDVTTGAGGLRGSTPPDLIKLMIQADDMAPDDRGRKVWYANRRVHTWLRIQATYKSNVNLTFETFAGKKVLAFMGNPIRKVDALRNNESRVV